MKYLILLFIAQSAFAGGAVGNGGDIIRCQKSIENKFSGDLVLDYVAAYDGQTDLISATSNPVEKIWRNFYEKGKTVPFFTLMAESFLVFFQSSQDQLFKNPQYQNYYIWIPQPFGLVDILDEDLVQLVPKNCLVLSNGIMKPDLIQAVDREDKTSSVILRYDPSALKNLSSLQFSYLIVHEWLRASFQKMRILRDVNQLIHSQVFHQATAKAAAQMLENVTGRHSFPIPYQRNPVEIEVSVPSDLGAIKNAVYQSTTSIPLHLSIRYGASNITCSLQDTSKGKPILIADGCANDFFIFPGQTYWISSRTSGITVPLVEIVNKQPDFKMPQSP